MRMDDGRSGMDDLHEQLADEREAEGRRGYEEHRERVAQLIAKLPAPPDEAVVFDASKGAHLIDVIEATADVAVHPADAWVRLPHGYASVSFLRMLFAVSG